MRDFLAALALAAGDPDPDFHLYLLAGQSNMAGRGALDGESGKAPDRVLVLRRDLAWAPATDPLHFDKPIAAVGPGLAFGRRLAEAHPKGRIGLVPCAVGGSSILAWAPGAADAATKTHPYDDFLARAREARKAGVFKGVIWHQGESDRGKLPDYPAKLKDLVERLRRDLEIPDLPFVAGELTPAFNEALRGAAAAIPAFAVVPTGDLHDKGDRLHYDTPSARTLGVRYADALLRLRR
jgi:hypothetical protein